MTARPEEPIAPRDPGEGPAAIFDALPSGLLDLLETPWDAVPERPGQAAVRHAFFGANSEGMLTLLIDDETETLRIIDILWMG